jgi:drug/metabolite transporter (DMT)-like permease
VRPPNDRLLIALAFASVYLIWGTSFAVTKLMVLSAPPFIAGALRFLLAGTVLVGASVLTGGRLPDRAIEWRHAGAISLLQVVGSAGLNILAMQHIASNQSALLNASGALWIPLIAAIGSRGEPITGRVATGLGVGFVGVALLLWPRQGYTLDHAAWQFASIGAAFSWGVGTIYYRRSQSVTPMPMQLGLGMLMGAAVLGAMGLAAGELPRFHASVAGIGAIVFLALFNSCIAYTAYAYLMRRTTPAKLSTYAYVNPLIAVVTGWLAFNERLSSTQFLGMAVILGSVALVTIRVRTGPRR